MEKVVKIILCIAVLVCMYFAFHAGFWLRRQVDIDGCLDAGGRWNYERGWCEF